MSSMKLVFFIQIAISSLSFAVATTTTPKGVSNKPPHVLLVVLDDLGYSDVSFHGGLIPTPFMDELSGAGIRLDRYYLHPVCSPSRISLLTGSYSHLHGFGSGGALLGPAP